MLPDPRWTACWPDSSPVIPIPRGLRPRRLRSSTNFRSTRIARRYPAAKLCSKTAAASCRDPASNCQPLSELRLAIARRWLSNGFENFQLYPGLLRLGRRTMCRTGEQLAQESTKRVWL